MTKTLKILAIILGGLIVVAIGLAGYLIWQQQKLVITPQPTGQKTATTKPNVNVTLLSDLGVTWIEPEPLSDLGLIKIGVGTTGISGVKYYKIANLDSGGMLVLASLEFEGPALPVFYRFKQDGEGNYRYLARHSTENDIGVVSLVLEKTITIDQDTIYQSLSAPDFLTVNNATLKSSNNVGMFTDLKDPKEIGQSSYGKIYQTLNTTDQSKTGGSSIDLKLVDSTYKVYTIKAPFMTDDEVAQITWLDGAANSSKYTSEGYIGCGMTASDNVIIDTTGIESRLQEIGKTNENEIIYTVSENDPIMVSAYENYKIGRTELLSLTDFANKKPVLIWKSPLDVYVIFTGRDFGGLAECGKPVIYLYPKQPTKVTVKVGAEITKSEPVYNNGWQVIAEPSGRLHINQETYKYLYWEGRGQDYPLLNEGTVVKQDELLSALNLQLSQLGLNNQEKADFLEFWLPKMPKTPYIRLTWFGTNLMNQLAPLSISPAPDTIIRIFLDFRGLESPINITPQNLSAPERKGFTVIEWGGLLKE